MNPWIKFDETDPFGPRFWVVAVLAMLVNIAMLGAAVWIVVKVLQWTGVIA